LYYTGRSQKSESDFRLYVMYTYLRNKDWICVDTGSMGKMSV